jgi:hypothetical protein
MIMESIPLLEPGLHDFEIEEIGNHFLLDFPTSKTRKSLIEGLTAFIAHLADVGAPIELWIDGSFTTKKTDPNDIDLVIFSPAEVINKLPADKQALFQVLTDRPSMKKSFGCDVLFCPSEDLSLRSYWRGWYGFDRNEQAKGIARVTVAS